MSRFDEPVKPEALIVGVFGVAILAMCAVPIAFVFAVVAGLAGLGGTQNTWTIIGSFALVFLVGATGLIYAMWRAQG